LVRGVAVLPLDRPGRAAVLRVPVGCAAARDRLHRLVLGPLALAFAADRGSAATRGIDRAGALAPVPADVLVGDGQADERGSDLAQPHGAHVSLSDPALATLDRVVRPPAAAGVPSLLGVDDVRDRGCGAVLHRGAAPAAVRRGRYARRAPAP